MSLHMKKGSNKKPPILKEKQQWMIYRVIIIVPKNYGVFQY